MVMHKLYTTNNDTSKSLQTVMIFYSHTTPLYVILPIPFNNNVVVNFEYNSTGISNTVSGYCCNNNAISSFSGLVTFRMIDVTNSCWVSGIDCSFKKDVICSSVIFGINTLLLPYPLLNNLK